MGICHEIELPKNSEIAMLLIRKNLWSNLSHKSFISGMWLRVYENTPLWNNCFLHVLPIGKWRYFKYYYKNIILCSPGETALWMQGTEESRISYALEIEEKSRGKQTANWDIIKTLEADLIKDYKKYFPSTKGMFLNYHYSLQEQSEILGKLNRQFLNSLK